MINEIPVIHFFSQQLIVDTYPDSVCDAVGCGLD